MTGLLRGTGAITIAADACPFIAATGNPEVVYSAAAPSRRREELAHTGRDRNGSRSRPRGQPAGGRPRPWGSRPGRRCETLRGGVAAGGKRDYCLTAAVDGGWRRCRPPRRLGILGPGEKPDHRQFGPRELTPTRRGFLQRGDDMPANAQAEAPGTVAIAHAKKGTRTDGRPSVRPRLVARLRRAGQRRQLQAIGSGGAALPHAAAAPP